MKQHLTTLFFALLTAARALVTRRGALALPPVLALVLAGVVATAADATTYAWTTRAPMLTARESLGLASVGGKLYAVGGVDHSLTGLPPAERNRPGSTVEEYDPAANAWTAKASMPTSRYHLGMAALDGKLYAVGGTSGGYRLATVEQYDPASNTWTAKAPMPTARLGLAVAALDGKLYAVGGTNGSGNHLAAVEEYDPRTDTWTAKAPMPTPRYGLAVAALDGKLYAVGGFGDASVAVKVEEYDPATNTWIAKARMPTPRGFLGAGALDGKLYVVGGSWSASGPQAIVEEYDPRTDTWMAQAPMLTGRNSLSVATLPGKLYAVGGVRNNTYLATVEEMVVAGPAALNTTPAARAGNDQTAVEGALVTMDGGASSDADGDALTYTWTLVSSSAGAPAVALSTEPAPATPARPTFATTDQGTYTFRLTVTDGKGGTHSDDVVVTVANAAPTATITGGPAAASGVPGGTPLTFGSTVIDPSSADTSAGFTRAWSVAKDGAPVAVRIGTATTAASFTFTPGAVGTYVVTLAATDKDGAQGSDSRTFQVTNTVPVARAGQDQAVVEGSTVTLDGSASGDADGDALAYSWTLHASSTGTPAVDLSSATAATPTFKTTDQGTYTFHLTVSDGRGGTHTDDVTVTVANAAPTAAITGGPAAGASVLAGTALRFGGTITDPSSADTAAGFRYAWSVTKDGATLALPAGTSTTGATFGFTPVAAGSYVVTLAAADKEGAQGTAGQTIDVTVPVLSVADARVAEGSRGTATAMATFAVSLSQAGALPVTVAYATADGTATSGAAGSCGARGIDYEAERGTLTIPAGATSGSITVTLCVDARRETDESFALSLSAPSGASMNATLARSVAVGTIANDDGAPRSAPGPRR